MSCTYVIVCTVWASRCAPWLMHCLICYTGLDCWAMLSRIDEARLRKTRPSGQVSLVLNWSTLLCDTDAHASL